MILKNCLLIMQITSFKKKQRWITNFKVERFYIRDVQLQSNFYRGSLHTWFQQDWIPHHIISCRAVFLGVRVDSLELNVFLFKNDFKSFLPYFLVLMIYTKNMTVLLRKNIFSFCFQTSSSNSVFRQSKASRHLQAGLSARTVPSLWRGGKHKSSSTPSWLVRW